MFVFKHPKYYDELRKKRKQLEQEAKFLGEKERKDEATSGKDQASSNKRQAPEQDSD
jgi:hypothetical protein